MWCRFGACLLSLLVLASAPRVAAQEEPALPPDVPPREALIIPAFPGSRAFQFRLESEFVPSAGLENGTDVSVYGGSARLRIAAPVSDRVGVQVVTRFGVTHYDFDGSTDPFGTGPSSGNPFDELYDAGVRLQAALLLHQGDWLFKGERWSLLAELGGGGRWEAGAFDDGLVGGGALALGYEIPGRLEIAVGAVVRNKLADDGVRVGPVVSARWRVTPDLTLRTRGTGGQVEYRVMRRLTVFATAFQTGRRWRLENRRGLPGRLSLQDKQVRAGLGLEWRFRRQFRLNLEAGAIADRTLEVRRRNSSLFEEDGDVAGYLVVSLDLKP